MHVAYAQMKLNLIQYERHIKQGQNELVLLIEF